VHGSGFRVERLGFEGFLWFRVQGLGLRVQGLGCRVDGFGFWVGVQGLGFKGLDFWFEI